MYYTEPLYFHSLNVRLKSCLNKHRIKYCKRFYLVFIVVSAKLNYKADVPAKYRVSL